MPRAKATETKKTTSTKTASTKKESSIVKSATSKKVTKAKTGTIVANPHLNGSSQVKKLTPKEIQLFKCEKITDEKKGKICGGVHFRHAGYVELSIPAVMVKKKDSGDLAPQEKLIAHSLPVKVCIKCKTCYVQYEEHWYDVTDKIDLSAWEKSETELNRATGPGGEC